MRREEGKENQERLEGKISTRTRGGAGRDGAGYSGVAKTLTGYYSGARRGRKDVRKERGRTRKTCYWKGRSEM